MVSLPFLPPLPPISPQALSSAIPLIQRLLRGALGVEDVNVAVDGITVQLTIDPQFVRELRPEIQEYLRIEGVKATAQLLVAWATFQDSLARTQQARTQERAASLIEEDQRLRRTLGALLEENTQLQRQLLATVERDVRMSEHLRDLLPEPTRLKLTILTMLETEL